MNASADYPNLTGLPSFSKLAILALKSYLESSSVSEEEVVDLMDVVWLKLSRSSNLAVDDPLRSSLMPYLLRYDQLLRKELESLPEHENDDRIADIGDQLQLLCHLFPPYIRFKRRTLCEKATNVVIVLSFRYSLKGRHCYLHRPHEERQKRFVDE
jgi:hypothetical protein